MNTKTTNYVLIAVAGLTFVMQGIMFYRDANGRPATRVSAQTPMEDAPKGTFLDLSGLPIEGNPTAQIVVVEFSDYECPFCLRHMTNTAPEFDKQFVRPGKVMHAFVNNPLPMHFSAKSLATAAVCAQEQGHFWEMHAALFAKKPRDKAQILEVARDLHLDSAKFENCSANAAADKRISAEINIAKGFSLNGTPSFAIGLKVSSRRIEIQKFLKGALPLDVFSKAIADVQAKEKV